MNATKSAKAVVKNAAPTTDPKRNFHSQSVQVPRGLPGTPAKIFRTIVRSLIAIILIWAALSKLGDPLSAYTALLDYQLPAPTILTKLVAVVLPWLELLCGLMLLANYHRRLATLATAAFFSVFLVMAGQALARGLDISCGCFNLAILGIDEASAAARFLESVSFAFGRNLVLLGGALYLLRIDTSSSSVNSLSTR